MAPFLVDDVVHMIAIEHLNTFDFRELCLVNVEFHEFFTAYLYRQYDASYDGNGDPRPFWPFFRTLLEREDLRAHVQEVKLRPWLPRETIQDLFAGSTCFPGRLSQQEHALYKRLLDGHLLANRISPGPVRDDLLESNSEVTYPCESREIVALLSCLPNIRTLHLGGNQDSCEDMVTNVLECLPGGDECIISWPSALHCILYQLDKLEEVRITGYNEQMSRSLWGFDMLFRLPSLTTFAYDQHFAEAERLDLFNCSPGTSAVHSLSVGLWTSTSENACDYRIVPILARACRVLRKFEYRESYTNPTDDAQISLAEIALNHAASLETVYLSSSVQLPTIARGELRNFTSLKQVNLDYSSIFGGKTDSRPEPVPYVKGWLPETVELVAIRRCDETGFAVLSQVLDEIHNGCFMALVTFELSFFVGGRRQKAESRIADIHGWPETQSVQNRCATNGFDV